MKADAKFHLERRKDKSNEEIIQNIMERMNGLMPLNAALLDELFNRLRKEMTSV